MRNLLRIALSISILAATRSRAQQPAKLPTFPLPDRFLPQSRWPEKSWPSAMKRELQQAFQCKRCRNLMVSRISLGALGTGAIVDQRDNPCEAQAGACSNLMLMYRANGRYLLQDILGRSSAGVAKSQGNIPDIIGVNDFPCCSGDATRYSYSLSQQIFIESGCDQIDYDKFGDFKGAEVHPCN